MKIKNCPCCNGQAKVLTIENTQQESSIDGAKYIECVDCRLSTPLVYSCGEIRLLEIWNKRCTL